MQQPQQGHSSPSSHHHLVLSSKAASSLPNHHQEDATPSKDAIHLPQLPLRREQQAHSPPRNKLRPPNYTAKRSLVRTATASWRETQPAVADDQRTDEHLGLPHTPSARPRRICAILLHTPSTSRSGGLARSVSRCCTPPSTSRAGGRAGSAPPTPPQGNRRSPAANPDRARSLPMERRRRFDPRRRTRQPAAATAALQIRARPHGGAPQSTRAAQSPARNAAPPSLQRAHAAPRSRPTAPSSAQGSSPAQLL